MSQIRRTVQGRNLWYLGVAILLACGLAPRTLAQTEPSPTAAAVTIPSGPVTVKIDTSVTSEPVSPYEYGMFIEPIGRLVDSSLWAQMLDDRKFFYPILPAAAQPPSSQNGGPRFMRFALRKWTPVGDPSAVTMDTAAPYVGEQSPQIVLSSDEARGIEQSGIAIVAGKKYVGRIVAKCSSPTTLDVSLTWADGGSQDVKITSRGSGWNTYPFTFQPSADSGDATFAVSAKGAGSYEIGAVSLMPADNLGGWRADVVAQLRQIHSGFWRLPGGNYLSNWDWHDAIGPSDLRRPFLDHAWNAMQTNDIGMDEWMHFCKLIGTMPYITVNAGLGDGNSAAEEVEYINGPTSTYWGGMRAKDGHPAPYGVKFWDIGNEPYGAWQIGQTTLPYYILKHIDFATRMWRADPSITLLASGAMPDQRAPAGAPPGNSDMQNTMPKFGTPLDWSGGLFKGALPYFDGITEHWYDSPPKIPDSPDSEQLLQYAREPSNDVRIKADEWQVYRKTYPGIDKRHIFLSIDEYGYMGGNFGPPNVKTMLAYAMVLQEMLRHTDFLRMSAMTTGVSLLNITPTQAGINTLGRLYQLYGARFGAGMIPVQVTGDSPWPLDFPAGFGHPHDMAGSPTWPLDVIAALTPDHHTLTVGVVNATVHPQTLNLDVSGATPADSGTEYLLTGPTLDSADTLADPNAVRVKTINVSGVSGGLSVPPASVAIFEISASAR